MDLLESFTRRRLPAGVHDCSSAFGRCVGDVLLNKTARRKSNQHVAVSKLNVFLSHRQGLQQLRELPN
jgi:hypothetical protein